MMKMTNEGDQLSSDRSACSDNLERLHLIIIKYFNLLERIVQLCSKSLGGVYEAKTKRVTYKI